MKAYIQEEFKKIYGNTPDKVFFAPARVNLIGEHIDYNGGLVMPCALGNGTYLAIRKTTDNTFTFRSLNFPEIVHKIPVNTSGYAKEDALWINYPLGCIDYFIREGKTISGLEFLFYGNIPNGGGLSSSASIELVTSFALNNLFNLGKTQVELVKISQQVENKFVGVNCGIMDQFAIGMGKKDQAIILDCQTLEYSYTPFVLKDNTLLIINTNKERKLADSKYNERRATCEAALEIFNKTESFKDLCSIPVDYFEENKHLLTEEMQKRVKHVIYENLRVKESEKALKSGDIEKFGKLMSASHKSLMEDYEVTGKELDTIYLESVDFKGVTGVRMTGAGFGGCAIALVKNDRVEAYKKYIEKIYTDKIGYAPSIYDVSIGEGTREI
ncbi:galactokinase [Capnocytophaga catalasegens]|uniref:Galactokinase n=1 Tax=Capnocytophaga catalasegens TaxID=1004260 RepID=A0AAV5AUV7_9FLAO|nr:galactokinase [Capnocytophaga catalasegens]GIZ16232.1 galactokinase [Capnocytophaga catalasegens]GJM49460.1 galactokinase [Capnocytophaga catalasegens]GJM53634.1 galactokinase [Capnocytophaga catalasegens]